MVSRFNNAKPQQFLFDSASYISYILKNLKPQHLKNLYPTCKYFYAKLQIQPIDVLCITYDDPDEGADGKYTLYLPPDHPNFGNLNKIWLSEAFSYNATPEAMSLLMPKIYRSDISELQLSVDISLTDYEKLTESGNIERMQIGRVFDENNKAVPIDAIFRRVPNIRSIDLTSCHGTPESFQNMLTMTLNHKLEDIYIHFEDLVPDVSVIYEFLKKNAFPEANVWAEVGDDPNFDQLSALRDALINVLNTWDPPEEAPTLNKFYFFNIL